MKLASHFILAVFVMSLAACSGSKHQEASVGSENTASKSSFSQSRDAFEAEPFFSIKSTQGLKNFTVSDVRAEKVNESLNINFNLKDGRAFQINGIRGLREEQSEASNFQLVLLNFKAAPHQAFASQDKNKLIGRIKTNLQGLSDVSVRVQGELIKTGDDTLQVEALFKNLKIETSEIVPE